MSIDVNILNIILPHKSNNMLKGLLNGTYPRNARVVQLKKINQVYIILIE